MCGSGCATVGEAEVTLSGSFVACLGRNRGGGGWAREYIVKLPENERPAYHAACKDEY